MPQITLRAMKSSQPLRDIGDFLSDGGAGAADSTLAGSRCVLTLSTASFAVYLVIWLDPETSAADPWGAFAAAVISAEPAGARHASALCLLHLGSHCLPSGCRSFNSSPRTLSKALTSRGSSGETSSDSITARP